MTCERCCLPIVDGDIYFEAKRRGQHDVCQHSIHGYVINHVPLYFHVNCENREVSE